LRARPLQRQSLRRPFETEACDPVSSPSPAWGVSAPADLAVSGFARVVQRALEPRNGDKVMVQHYAAYTPSAFAPHMFAAVPIIADGQTIAVFVAAHFASIGEISFLGIVNK